MKIASRSLLDTCKYIKYIWLVDWLCLFYLTLTLTCRSFLLGALTNWLHNLYVFSYVFFNFRQFFNLPCCSFIYVLLVYLAVISVKMYHSCPARDTLFMCNWMAHDQSCIYSSEHLWDSSVEQSINQSRNQSNAKIKGPHYSVALAGALYKTVVKNK